jgi:ribose-phosphate pyrophosphokinase
VAGPPFHRMRESGSATRVTHLVGHVRDRVCLIVDDMISTGGTIVESVHILPRCGARPEIYVAPTHGLFLREARQDSPSFRLRVSCHGHHRAEPDGLAAAPDRVGGPLIGQVIERVMANGSIATCFDLELCLPASAHAPFSGSGGVRLACSMRGPIQAPVGNTTHREVQ